jgi:iron complex transport system substrate-binding protein
MGKTAATYRADRWIYSPFQRPARILLPAIIWGLLAGLSAMAAAGEIVDPVGRTVRAPDDPRRVIALAPSITEIVFALGEDDRLAGVTRFSYYPEAATRLPRGGCYVHLDLERIAALNPDLCIAVKDGNPI